MPNPLDAEVLHLLKERRGDWTTIARELGISYSWLTKFIAGNIASPSYKRLAMIHKHLAGPSKARIRLPKPTTST